MNRIGIIGGGAAGMAAAAFASGSEVMLFEKNEKLGKKVYITGKGRCNITNNRPLYEFTESIVRGNKFMMGALSKFGPAQLMEFLDLNGVRCKTERGSRVFPESDKASDVIKAFSRAISKSGCNVLLGTGVLSVEKENGEFRVKTTAGDYLFDRVIIATGGLSYPLTGSTGDGHRVAKAFGHSLTECVPGLNAVEIAEDYSALEGITLKNVALKGNAGGTKIYEFGEMFFEKGRMDGPIVLTLSSKINRLKAEGLKLSLDLKPALSPETLDDRLITDLTKFRNEELNVILKGLLPRAFIPFVLGYTGINGKTKGNSVTREMRYALGFIVKNFPVTVKRIAPVEEAVITSGGVELKELNPQTMESKLVKGLYFAGEVADVDCLTGGYNLQCAVSMGVAAARAASKEE